MGPYHKALPLRAKDLEQFYSRPSAPRSNLQKPYKRVSSPIFTPIRNKIGILINFASQFYFGKISKDSDMSGKIKSVFFVYRYLPGMQQSEPVLWTIPVIDGTDWWICLPNLIFFSFRFLNIAALVFFLFTMCLPLLCGGAPGGAPQTKESPARTATASRRLGEESRRSGACTAKSTSYYVRNRCEGFLMVKDRRVLVQKTGLNVTHPAGTHKFFWPRLGGGGGDFPLLPMSHGFCRKDLLFGPTPVISLLLSRRYPLPALW